MSCRPYVLSAQVWWPFLTVPRKARQRRGCGAGGAGPHCRSAAVLPCPGSRRGAGARKEHADLPAVPASGRMRQAFIIIEPLHVDLRPRSVAAAGHFEQATRLDRLHPLFRRLLHRHHRLDRRHHRACAGRLCRSAVGDPLSISDSHLLDRHPVSRDRHDPHRRDRRHRHPALVVRLVARAQRQGHARVERQQADCQSGFVDVRR